MQKYSLQFEKPALLEVTTSDGLYKKDFDVLAAYRMLQEADKQPTQDAKWAMIVRYLKASLGIQADHEIAEGMAYEFREAIIGLFSHLAETVKKKLQKIASSPPSTLESPTTS